MKKMRIVKALLPGNQIKLLITTVLLIVFVNVKAQKFGITDGTGFTPNYLTQIHLNNAAGTFLQFTNTTSTNSPSYGLIFNSTNTNSLFNIQISNLDSGYLCFSTNNNERLRITETGNIGIGVTDPQNKLHIYSTSDPLRLEGLQNNSTDKIFLVTTPAGVIQKSTFLNTDWSLTGNSGTNSASNFLGTTDNHSLTFRTNNSRRMIIDSLGNIGIGITNPSANFHVTGTTAIFGSGEGGIPAAFTIRVSSRRYQHSRGRFYH